MKTSFVFAVIFGVCVGCGAESGNGVSTSQLRVALTSSSSSSSGDSRDLMSAIVRIRRVTAHSSGGWVTVRGNAAVDVDVLRLAEKSVELGFGELPHGDIDQIRLLVDTSTPPYVVGEDGERGSLKVPSGEQSGIKVRGRWTVNECERLSLSIDMDSRHAVHIHRAGNRDHWILRPTIKAVDSMTQPIEDCVPGGSSEDVTDPVDDEVNVDQPADEDPSEDDVVPEENDGAECINDDDCTVGAYCGNGVCASLNI